MTFKNLTALHLLKHTCGGGFLIWLISMITAERFFTIHNKVCKRGRVTEKPKFSMVNASHWFNYYDSSSSVEKV